MNLRIATPQSGPFDLISNLFQTLTDQELTAAMRALKERAEARLELSSTQAPDWLEAEKAIGAVNDNNGWAEVSKNGRLWGVIETRSVNRRYGDVFWTSDQGSGRNMAVFLLDNDPEFGELSNYELRLVVWLVDKAFEDLAKKSPTQYLAVLAGMRDKSYGTVRYGALRKYVGTVTITMGDGRRWEAVGTDHATSEWEKAITFYLKDLNS